VLSRPQQRAAMVELGEVVAAAGVGVVGGGSPFLKFVIGMMPCTFDNRRCT
jgi:hypothetical protein